MTAEPATKDPACAHLRFAPSRPARYGLVLAVGFAAAVETRLVNSHLMLPTIYFGPGLVLATLYSLDGAARLRMLGAMLLALTAGYLTVGVPTGSAALMAIVVGAQACIGAVVLRRLAPDGLDFTKTQTFASLVLVAILATPLAGLAIQELLARIGPAMADIEPVLSGNITHFFQAGMVTVWLLPHTLGILLATPIAAGFCAWSHSWHRRWFTGERLLVLAGNAVVAWAVFDSTGHSHLFLIYPPLVWTGLRLGVCDTAAAVLISLVIASIAVAHGHGPVVVLQADSGHPALFLELLYLCVCASIMPIAASLEYRRRLEADLARGLEFTEQVMRHMRDIVFRTDARGRWTSLNPAWKQVTGYGVPASLGRDSNALVVANDPGQAPVDYAGLIAGKIDEMNFQQRIRRRDGDIREITVNMRAYRSAGGHFLGTTGTIRDISEPRRHIRALESSERRFRQLCDMAPIGIVRCDRHGSITYANRRLESIVLTSVKYLLGQNWLTVLGSENPDVIPHLLTTLTTVGAVFEHELSFRDTAGLHRWLNFTATGEFDADERRTGYIVGVTDITLRKAAERELASRTHELRLLTESINDMIFRIGLDGVCRYASPSVRDVLGLEPQDLIGNSVMRHVNAEDMATVDEAFTRITQGVVGRCTFAFRLLGLSPATDGIWLEANCRLLRDKAGVPFELVAALRDISERKRLEFGFIAAGQLAELATAAKTTFVANLSHEIRTPMNGVIGLTELLLGGDLDDTGRRYATLIAESGAAMMQLLNDILDIAKIDSGRLQLTTEEFDLHHCLTSSLGLMTASAGAKQLDLRLEIARDVPSLMLGDSLRLRQVLANLIGNAIKFTEAGHVLVTARRDGEYLEIRIVDTGIGIAPREQLAVFDEFIQANATISNSHGGTGLGLSISRRLSEAMGGTLTLNSRIGHGTTLVLRIPAQFVAVPAPTLTPPVQPAEIELVKPLHILVAEDNRTNQIIMNGMLQRLGHVSALAANGAQVITMVEQATAAGTPFDLVLMDIQMPVMDGIAATAQLRATGFTANELPIIAVTANGYPEDIERCLAAGMQDFVTKPMRLADLQAALSRLGQADETTGAPLGRTQSPLQVR